MQFNEFLWNNFKGSKHGEELIRFFVNYSENTIEKKNIALYRSIAKSITCDNRESEPLDKYFDCVNDFCRDLPKLLSENSITADPHTIDDIEEIYDCILNWVEDDEGLENGDPMYRFSEDSIPYLSEGLYILYPEYFFPYYFHTIYYQVEAIFNEFGIYLPPVPAKNNIEKRMLHYLELAKSLYNFRLSHDMDKHELPAFLYGFAVNVIKKYEITDILPEPRKAYFVGAGKNDNGDFDFFDESNDNTISRWNGNPDTQPGDIIVMYCLSPRSYIHSIWRAITPGFIDPFFHYYKTIYIGKPISVKPISISELKTDPVLSEMSLIKANMQGINGRIISKKYYDRIIHILKEKGENTDSLPQLNDEIVQEFELRNERDVEKNLLEPLLHKLGFAESDWKRQLKIRMGRGEKVFPDYVIFPNDERNNESGFWVWEAKHSISNQNQLKEDFGQAKSYALRLNCKGLGLVAKEGVWLSMPDYSFDKLRFWSWTQLKERDSLNEIFDLAGMKLSNCQMR